MDLSSLTEAERRAIESGPWFAGLSPALRHDILHLARLRRLRDGEPVAMRGARAEDWCGVARGSVCVSAVSMAGKQVTMAYVEPGAWFGDIALFDGGPRTHDASAHGDTTLLCVGRTDFRRLLSRHVELYDALLRLNCRRLRSLFTDLEEMRTKPLAARLARQILQLAKTYGTPHGGEIRIGLQLAQEELAQLLGASRQRVNQELKGFERGGALRIEPPRLVVLSRAKLEAITAQ